MINTATQKSSESEINQLNLAMRQSQWYQDFFAKQGLNANKVKLSENQRNQLAQLANQNGYHVGDRMKIDEAGNINQKGGFAGMPTWAKIAIAAAPIAATAGFGAAGMGPMAGMFGANGGAMAGELGATMGTGAYAVPTATATTSSLGGLTIPTVAGAAKKGVDTITQMMEARDRPQDLADIGSLLGNVAESEGSNRMNNFDMMNSHGNLSLRAQEDRRAQESDAMRKIQQAGYIKSGGTPYDASQVKLSGGRSLPSFNFPRAPITDEAKQAAGTLESEMLKRVGPQGSYTPPPLEDYTKRTGLEKATNVGSMVSGGLGAIDKMGQLGKLGSGAMKAGKTLWDWFS